MYTQATAKGAIICPYYSIKDLTRQLVDLLNNCRSKAYYYVHWAGIDKAGHLHGSYSFETKSEIDLLSSELERGLIENLNATAKASTSLIVTADHGQVSVNPENAIYLNDYPEVINHLKRADSGTVILPAGGARNVFLSIEDDAVEAVAKSLNLKLKNIARAIVLNEGVISELFGEGKQHPMFHSRLGNMIVLPLGNNTIWYQYYEGKMLTEMGDHGGLTSDEMHIPCITIRMDNQV